MAVGVLSSVENNEQVNYESLKGWQVVNDFGDRETASIDAR